MKKEANRIHNNIRVYISIGLGIAAFSLVALPNLLYFTYNNQLEISIIVLTTFTFSIVSYFINKLTPEEKYASYEFLFYTVTIGLIIHFIGYLNGPLIFMYGLVILSSSYFLEPEFLNYIAGISVLFVVSEYFVLITGGSITISAVSIVYLCLRLLYLVLLANFGKRLGMGIRAQRKQFLQLLKLNKELSEIDKLKRDFIDIASHSLKTPLTAIKGNISMMLDGDYGQVSKNLLSPLNEIDLGTRRLSTVVDDVVNSLQFEKNIPLKLNMEITNIQRLTEDEIDTFLANAWVKNVKLHTRIDPKIPSFFIDQDKIKVALSIFVENAIDHSLRNGKITINVSKRENEAYFEVTDNGPSVVKEISNILSKRPGEISREELDKIGLNLYLARRIVESHQGKIFFETRDESSNVFGFSIPIKMIGKKEKKKKI